MKKMTCNQLGGVCDIEFLGETFKKQEFNNLSSI